MFKTISIPALAWLRRPQPAGTATSPKGKVGGVAERWNHLDHLHHYVVKSSQFKLFYKK
jgi:hypothetical protein